MPDHVENDNSFPVLFTVADSGDHGVVWANPFDDLEDLYNDIFNAIQDGEEHNSKGHEGKTFRVSRISVRWDPKTRDSSLYPQSTVLTEANFQAIFRLISLNGSRDILEAESEPVDG
jgi:hypothetical protein